MKRNNGIMEINSSHEDQQTTSMYRLANEPFMKISRAEVVDDEVGRRRREPARLIESYAASSAS
jgi:hypothetical protein